jgi:DNA invertase Pin-like site-specific DNA recombinase
MARRRLSAVPANAGRVLLYVRVSALKGRGGDDFHSPEVQLDGMRNLISREGLREVGVIDDDIDASGQSINRRGIARIRAMVEARQVDVVAVYMLSRVGRNLAESLAFIRWLREHGVSIISANEKIDDSPEGQFMVGMWLNMAELQGNQIGQGWARIIERRAKLGRHHGNVPQGYLRTDDGYTIDPHLGPAVTAAFVAYANGSHVAEITDAFAAARGRPVAKSRVKAMLRNPIYAGRVVVHSSTGGTIDVPGVHPPLVDDITWVRAQRRMDADRQTPPRHLAPAYSLTGLGICPYCRRKLQIWNSTEKGKDNPTRRLTCTRKWEVRDCEGIGTPLYAPIEDVVLDEVRKYAAGLRGNPTARAAQEARTARAGVDATAIERDLARTREAMGRLTERWARRAVPDEAYEQALSRLTAAQEAQVAQLEVAREVSDAPSPGEVVHLVDEMFEMWPDMTEAERNRALKSVLRRFTVRRAGFWREPEEDRISGFEFRW